MTDEKPGGTPSPPPTAAPDATPPPGAQSPDYMPPGTQPPLTRESYQPGLGTHSMLPPELKKFNWGTFLWGWIWCIGNRVWWALAVSLLLSLFVGPFVLIFNVYLGFLGNELAWKAKVWSSPEHFQEVQHKWAKWGVVFLVAWLVLWVLIVVAILAAAGVSSSTSGVVLAV